MTPIGRVRLLLALNVSTMVLVPLLTLGSGQGLANLPQACAFALVYTNITGLAAVLVGPSLVARLVRHRWPIAVAVVVTAVVLGMVGCLAAQALLTWTGVAVAEHFWRQYLQTLSAAVLLSIVFALGAVWYASIREQLRRAEERLHEKEVAEVRTEQL